MKKLVFLLVLLLAVGAYAGTSTNITIFTSPPSGPVPVIYDPPRIGNESRIIMWDSEPESDWGGGHRDIVQIFTPDVSLSMSDFAFRLDPRGGESSIYIPRDRECKVELYQMGASNYDPSQGTLLNAWTGGMLTSALNNPAPDSWIGFTFDSAYNLNAGVTYAVKFGMAYPVGSSKWDGGFISYGIFDPEAYAGNWAVYTGGDDQHYHKTWRTGRYAITPEPATIALISLGGLWLRRRK